MDSQSPRLRFQEMVEEAKHNIQTHEEEEQACTEAAAILRHLGRDLTGPPRWLLWRASHYIAHRDECEMTAHREAIWLSVLLRRAKHEHECNCGAYV